MTHAIKGSLAAILAFALLAAAAGSALGVGGSQNPNDPAYWLAQYPNAVACYKYEGTHTNVAHGKVTQNGKAVRLNPFQQQWPGDHWEVLVVKGGNEDGNTGIAGANVFELPVAGVDYYPPLNGGGKHPDISHFIVCKGQTPEPTATPTPTIEPTPTPTIEPTPTLEPTPEPTPSATPTVEPTPTLEPTPEPTVEPTATPTVVPSATVEPTPVASIPEVPDTAMSVENGGDLALGLGLLFLAMGLGAYAYRQLILWRLNR